MAMVGVDTSAAYSGGLTSQADWLQWLEGFPPPSYLGPIQSVTAWRCSALIK